ncbi:MAG: DUF5320 family protein [Candidatus Thermoplasmatota archaeon]
MVINMPYGYGWCRWPGRGPFSHLPPWERPGRIFGRPCWWMLAQYSPTLTAEQEKEILKKEMELLKREIERIKERIKEVEK